MDARVIGARHKQRRPPSLHFMSLSIHGVLSRDIMEHVSAAVSDARDVGRPTVRKRICATGDRRGAAMSTSMPAWTAPLLMHRHLDGRLMAGKQGAGGENQDQKIRSYWNVVGWVICGYEKSHLQNRSLVKSFMHEEGCIPCYLSSEMS